MKNIVKIFLACFLLESCALTYGFKKIESFDEAGYNDFKNFAEKELSCTSIIGTYEQRYYLITLSNDSIERKNLSQPIQILYFCNESLISYHTNCYAKGSMFGINWNTENRFNAFPPATAIKNPDKCLSLSDLKKTYPQILPPKNDRPYTIVLFWTNMLHKISKSAFKTINQNIQDFGTQDSCNIYIINDDDFFSKIANK